MYRIQLGDLIAYRRGYGRGRMHTGEIVEIGIMGRHAEDTIDVEEIFSDMVNRCVFVFDDGYWAYGNQLELDKDMKLELVQ